MPRPSGLGAVSWIRREPSAPTASASAASCPQPSQKGPAVPPCFLPAGLTNVAVALLGTSTPTISGILGPLICRRCCCPGLPVTAQNPADPARGLGLQPPAREAHPNSEANPTDTPGLTLLDDGQGPEKQKREQGGRSRAALPGRGAGVRREGGAARGSQSMPHPRGPTEKHGGLLLQSLVFSHGVVKSCKKDKGQGASGPLLGTFRDRA